MKMDSENLLGALLVAPPILRFIPQISRQREASKANAETFVCVFVVPASRKIRDEFAGQPVRYQSFKAHVLDPCYAAMPHSPRAVPFYPDHGF